MKKGFGILSIMVLAFAVLGACGARSQRGGGEAPTKGDLAGGTDAADMVFAVNTTTAVKGEINDFIELNGGVDTKSSVAVFADTTGKLASLSIRIGDRVARGQVIATVDPSRPGMVFEISPVTAPISGTVTSIPAKVGATVNQSILIAIIAITNDLEITTYVSERFISKMKVGLNVLLRFEAYPAERFEARVTELYPTVNPATRTMGVKIELKDRDDRIKPGMYAQIKIITEKKEGIVKLPSGSIVERFGRYYVFVVNSDSTVGMRNVTLGIEIDNKVEITEGLAEDEEVVVQGQTLLEDKAKVKVIDQIQPLSRDDILE
jgi:multidrug efflux pump subunit AcrA (membrane-fusion protein)